MIAPHTHVARGAKSPAGQIAIEWVSGLPEYDEYRSRGWYVVDEDGEVLGPFQSRRDAEYAAGREDTADE